jgi:hypothetical protein
VLSRLAALQGAILLIAAKRSDQIAGELARHDYEADTHTRDIVEHQSQEIAALRAEQSQLPALLDHREDSEIRSRRLARTATEG